MEKEINIAEILKEKPKGTKLYSSAIGECRIFNVGKNDIVVKDFIDNDYSFNKHGVLTGTNGECTLFPSNLMRDWSKFAWKKGDVVRKKVDSCVGIFDSFINDDYATFHALYYYDAEAKKYLPEMTDLNTLDFKKVDKINEMDYIKNIEGNYGGKLNLRTLEIVKLQFKDGDILYIEVGLYRSKYILIYCKDNEVFMPTYYCFLNLASSRHDDIFKVRNSSLPFSIICDEEDIMVVRLATDSEKQQLFSALEKEGKAWDVERKAIVDLPKKCEFKAFDKVLAKFDEDLEWMPDFFYYYDNTDNKMPYVCVANGRAIACIPYNDQTAHLLGTTDDWKGGEE